MDKRFLTFVVATLLYIGIVGGQLISKSDDDYTPNHLWQLDSPHHGSSQNVHKLYAMLHGAHLVPGPFNPARNGAIDFQGADSSYAEISHDGELNATSVFSWVMILKPDSSTVAGVILEYQDDDSGEVGVRLRHSGRTLIAEANDTSGVKHTVLAEDVLVDGSWTFIALSFMGFDKKKFMLYHVDYLNQKVDEKTSVSVPEGTTLKGNGTVRLGASFQPGQQAFSGELGCLRYYTSFIGKFQNDWYPRTCNQTSELFTNSLDFLSEYTMDYVETTTLEITTPQETTVQPTTEETTEPTTEETTQPTTEETTQPTTEETTQPTTEETTQPTTEETTQPTTEETTQPTTLEGTTVSTTADQTTVQTASEAASTTQPEDTTTTDSITGGPTNVISMNVTLEMFDAYDVCVSLHKEPSTVTFSSTSSILAQFLTNSLNACAGACISTSGCEALAIEKQVKSAYSEGKCLLGGQGYTTSFDMNFYFYHVV